MSEVRQLYEMHFASLYRVAFLYMKQEDDALDMVQETFLKLINSKFQSRTKEQTKGWLMVTLCNCCKTRLSHWWNKKRDVLEEGWLQNMESDGMSGMQKEVLEAVMELSPKYKVPVYLYYYEGYKTGEIAKMLQVNQSTIQSRLAKARQLLKMELLSFDEAATTE